MSNLALGLSAYAEDYNGNLPKKWADLVPNYLPDPTDYFCFQSPYTKPIAKVDILAHRELIDAVAPYLYMKLPDGRILVVERTGLWNDGKITYFLRGADGKPVGDAMQCHVSPEEFARRLAANFPSSNLMISGTQ